MPSVEMQQLYNQLKESQSTSPYYAPFLTAMETLNTEIASLMENDENGWKLLDQESYTRLNDKYREAGIQLEKYLDRTAESADPAEQALRKTADQFAALLAADASTVRQYDPTDLAHRRSLPSLFEESEIPTVDISSQKLESIGGAQNTRFPMGVVGANGEIMQGVFTQAQVFDPLGSFNRAAENAASSKGITPMGASLLRNFSSAYKAYYTEVPDPKKPVGDNPNMINKLMMSLRANPENLSSFAMSADKIAEEIGKVNGFSAEQVKQALGPKALDTFAKELKKIAFDVYIKADEVKMTDQTRIDKKNTGMSIVADVLGVSNVICHAQPMKVKTSDGKIIDGTFMALADGVDPNNPTMEAKKVDRNSLKNTDGRGLEAIADLQVLDYICGNVDRHGRNLFYQFDEDGKLIGVQGIDNDTSLGTDIPQQVKERVRNMPVCHIMAAISKKTAEKIMQIKPEELAFALRGTVDEESIEACANRLRVVQGAIKISRDQLDPNTRDLRPPYLRELTTEEFAKADLKKLTSSKYNNHFKTVNDMMGQIGARAMNANDPLTTKLVGSENRGTKAGVAGQHRKAQQMKKMLKDKTSIWRGSSSPNYKAIEQAVKDYEKLQKNIMTRIENSEKSSKESKQLTSEALIGRYVTSFDLDLMNQGMKKIKEAADTYATAKTAELEAAGKKPDDDPYIRDRINLAKDLSKYASEHMVSSNEEKESVRANERRAAEEVVRKMNKPAPQQQQQGMQNPSLGPKGF